MADPEEQTPYAEVLALQREGVASEAIVAKLKARGLDDEQVQLLMAAAATPAAAPPPEPEPALRPAPVALAPPPEQTCSRCGTFLEVKTYQLVLGKAYCPACAARADVNYPRVYRDAHWGRRSGWAWFMGTVSLLAFFTGAVTLTKSPGIAVGLLLSGVGYLLFWTGHRAGRPALVAVTVIGTVLNVTQGQLPNPFAIVFCVLALINPRTKLFFKLEVSERELAAAWLAQHDNLPAQWSAGLGLLSIVTIVTFQASWKFAFVTIGLGLFAMVLGVVGLRRVNLDAVPPVGRKLGAILGGLAGFFGALGAVLSLVKHFGVLP